MWQVKYASAVPKNLGVGVNFCCAVKTISSLGVCTFWQKFHNPAAQNFEEKHQMYVSQGCQK